MNEKEYLKGFNQGYLFRRHKPLLYETVSKGLVNDDYYKQGFQDGGKEYDLERGKKLLKERNGNQNTQEKGYEHDR